jgi:hypothetical protein
MAFQQSNEDLADSLNDDTFGRCTAPRPPPPPPQPPSFLPCTPQHSHSPPPAVHASRVLRLKCTETDSAAAHCAFSGAVSWDESDAMQQMQQVCVGISSSHHTCCLCCFSCSISSRKVRMRGRSRCMGKWSSRRPVLKLSSSSSSSSLQQPVLSSSHLRLASNQSQSPPPGHLQPAVS